MLESAFFRDTIEILLILLQGALEPKRIHYVCYVKRAVITSSGILKYAVEWMGNEEVQFASPFVVVTQT